MRISTLTLGAALLAAPLIWAQDVPADQQQQQGMPCPCPGGVTGTTVVSQPCPGVAVTRGVAVGPRSRQNSRLAAQMLQHTDMARKALKSNNRAEANMHINQAISLAHQVQSMQQPGTNIVPIYAELESTSVLQPTMEARTGQPAAVATPAPRTDEFQQQPQQQPGVVVGATTGQFTFVGVNTADSIAHLEAARMALSSNNPVAADDSLRAVESDVIATQVTGDMPLLQARQNLALASNYAKQSRYQEASAALDAAATGLANYSQTGRPHASEAQSLQQQIRAYEPNIQQQQPQQAANQIDTWWNQTASWFRQS